MILSTDYTAHEGFIAPARPYAALWRLAVGLIVATFAYIMLNQIFFQAMVGIVERGAPQLLEEVSAGQSPFAMYLLMFSFVFMSMGVGLGVRLLHQRSFMSLLGPLAVLIRDFWAVSKVVLIVMAIVLLLPPWDLGAPLIPNLSLGTWLVLFIPSVVFILIQVSAEEIVFRGYIQQQLAARFRMPLIWMGVPSALFALGHYQPDTAGENAMLIAAWAGMFSLMMADLTARSGSLGPAIAVHLWNNVSALMIISVPNELSGLALYLAPFGLDDAEAMRAWLPVDFVMMLVLWLAARLAIRR